MFQRLVTHGKVAGESSVRPSIGCSRFRLIAARVLQRSRNCAAEIGKVRIVVAKEIVRTLSYRIYRCISILGFTEDDYRRLGSMLVEVAHRRQTLPVGKKQV